MIGRINSDGDNNSTLISGPYLSIYTTFIATEDYLYFENGSQRIDLNTLKIADLFSKKDCYFEDEIQCFNIGAGYIFYSIDYGKSNANLLRVPISDDNPLNNVEVLVSNTGEWDIYDHEKYTNSVQSIY